MLDPAESLQAKSLNLYSSRGMTEVARHTTLAAFSQFCVAVQGCVLLAGLSFAWLWAATRRSAVLADVSRRALRTSAREDTSRAETESATAAARPFVTAVLPATGCTPAKLRNWESQLSSSYPGPLHTVFVVSTVSDDAVSHTRTSPLRVFLFASSHKLFFIFLPQFEPATRVAQELRKQSLHAPRTACVIVAGLSHDRSQKIANQRAGALVAPHATRYVVFLDDDVHLHPSSVESLVTSLENSPESLLATGFPCPIPSDGTSIFSLCVVAHALPLLIAFSHGRRTRNVWGGCMMFRSQDLSPSGCVSSVWGPGAFSDDLNIAALAHAMGASIECPGQAVFPAELPREMGFLSLWGFLHRSVYVLRTYANPHNRRVNSLLFVALVYGAVALLAAIGVATARLPFLRRPNTWSPCDAAAALVFILWVVAMLSARHFHNTVVSLCSALSPQWSLHRQPISWARFAVAMLLTQALLLAAAAATVCRSTVSWAGIGYTCQGGKVASVRHTAREGPKRQN